MARRPLLFACLGLLGAVLVVPIVFVALLGNGPGSGPSTSLAPTASALATWGAQPITEIEQAVWWRTGWRPLHDDAVAAPDFGRLTIGTFDGRVLGEVNIGDSSVARGSGPPFIVGPEMGLILYAAREGRAAALHLIDGGALDDRVLVTRRGLYHAALAPVSGYAYYAAGAPEPGIWRVRLDGQADPELVAAPGEIAGLRTDAVLTAPISELPKQVTMVLDETESRLAVFTCTDACVLRVIELASGDGFTIGVEPLPRELTDFIGDVVVIDGGVAFDVETKEPAPMPVGAREHVFFDVGWELPPGWRIEERAIGMGSSRFVVIDPDGIETPVDAMGQGIGNG